MTILEKKETTPHECRFVNGVECLPMVFNDWPSDEGKIVENCKACGAIHVAVELRRIADVIESKKRGK